jgi:type II secretory pathway component GspD/PulD (secretin)
MIRALEQRGGTKTLLAPKVTTLSGREARLDVAGQNDQYRVDLLPRVSADDAMICTTVTFQWTRGAHVDPRAQAGGRAPQPELPLHVSTTAMVPDGRTLVLGPFPKVETVVEKGKQSVREKNLFLLVTPTIIDPAGNPIRAAQKDGGRDPNSRN